MQNVFGFTGSDYLKITLYSLRSASGDHLGWLYAGRREAADEIVRYGLTEEFGRGLRLVKDREMPVYDAMADYEERAGRKWWVE